MPRRVCGLVQEPPQAQVLDRDSYLAPLAVVVSRRRWRGGRRQIERDGREHLRRLRPHLQLAREAAKDFHEKSLWFEDLGNLRLAVTGRSRLRLWHNRGRKRVTVAAAAVIALAVGLAVVPASSSSLLYSASSGGMTRGVPSVQSTWGRARRIRGRHRRARPGGP